MVDLSVTRASQKGDVSMLEKFKYANTTMKPNLLKIPCNEVNLEGYNEVVRYLNNLYDNKEINRGFIWTRKNYLSYKDTKTLSHNLNCYEVVSTNAMHEVVVCYDGKMSRIQYWHGKPEEVKASISGHKSFVKLKYELKKDNVNIEDFYINNGKEVKDTIEAPLIGCKNRAFIGLTFDNCHHIDLNWAYPSVMCDYHPEWSKTINRLYEKRKNSATIKAIGTHSYGYFQSSRFGYKLADVSKACIEKTKDILLNITEFIEERGRTVICYNTDGLWYTGDILDDDDDTFNSKELGGIKHDYVNGILRCVGDKGANYEFYGTDVKSGEVKLKVAFRGKCNLDDYKSRDEWEWGDILKALPKRFILSKDEYGVILEDREGDYFEI